MFNKTYTNDYIPERESEFTKLESSSQEKENKQQSNDQSSQVNLGNISDMDLYEKDKNRFLSIKILIFLNFLLKR